MGSGTLAVILELGKFFVVEVSRFILPFLILSCIDIIADILKEI